MSGVFSSGQVANTGLGLVFQQAATTKPAVGLFSLVISDLVLKIAKTKCT